MTFVVMQLLRIANSSTHMEKYFRFENINISFTIPSKQFVTN